MAQVQSRRSAIEASGADVLGSGVTVWVIILVLAVGAISMSVRIVSQRERVVVTRLGRVVRVAGPGLALRVPGIEGWHTVSVLPSRLPVGVSGVSLDGVQVHVQVLAVCRIIEPALSHLAEPDPFVAIRAEVESRVAQEIAHTEIAELLPLRARMESGLAEVLTTATGVFGVRVEEIQISDIEVQLTTALLDGLGHGRSEGAE